MYGSKVRHSTSKYRRTVWRCNHKYKRKKACTTPHFSEAAIYYAFVEAFNNLIADKEHYIDDCAIIVESLTDTASLEKKADKLREVSPSGTWLLESTPQILLLCGGALTEYDEKVPSSKIATAWDEYLLSVVSPKFGEKIFALCRCVTAALSDTAFLKNWRGICKESGIG